MQKFGVGVYHTKRLCARISSKRFDFRISTDYRTDRYRPMKRKPVRKDPTMVSILALLVVFGAGAFWLLKQTPKHPPPPTPPPPSNETLILQKLSKTKTASYCTPVHIFRGNIFAGSGTLVEMSVRGPRIVTSAHLFERASGTNLYFYRELQPHGNERKPIASIESIEGATQFKDEVDIALCVPGPARPIVGFSSFRSGQFETYQNEKWITLSDHILIRCLTTGEQTYCVGQMERMPAYFLLSYDSLPGESGTGFVSEKDELFVWKGRIMERIDADMRRQFRLPAAVKQLGFGVRVSIRMAP